MGTTVNNVHVYVGAELSAEDVAAVVAQPALVAPPEAGWVSVFPQAEEFGDDTLAVELSAALRRPAVSFFCFDSDIGIAVLIADGEVVDQLVVSWPGYMEEMMGDAAEAGADVSGGLPGGELLPGVTCEMEIKVDLDAWVSVLESQVTHAAVIDAVNADRDSPFADRVSSAILGRFGIAPGKLLGAYRFWVRGEDPDLVKTFLRT